MKIDIMKTTHDPRREMQLAQEITTTIGMFYGRLIGTTDRKAIVVPASEALNALAVNMAAQMVGLYSPKELRRACRELARNLEKNVPDIEAKMARINSDNLHHGRISGLDA